jgi:hypothetical protein
MREIEAINEPRMPFFPTTDKEAGQLRVRFDGLVEERKNNHLADVARLEAVENRLSEINDIHLSQPMFWQYKRKQEKAKVEIEWRNLQDEHKALRHVKDTTCTAAEARQAVLLEYPDYAPALRKHDEFAAAILGRIAERQTANHEAEKAAFLADRATQQAKAPEPAPNAPEREIEPSGAQETPSKRRDDSPSMDM